MSRSRIMAGLTPFVVALVLAGCSSAPNAPVPLGSPAGGALHATAPATPVAPLAADSVTLNAPITALTGGVVTCGPYRLTVPPLGVDRDITLQLRVQQGTGELEVSVTPIGAMFLQPYRIQCDVGFATPEQAGEYAMWWWDAAGDKWRRMPTSVVDPRNGTVRAFATGAGRFQPMPWSIAEPLATLIESAVDVGAADGGTAACGEVRVAIPPGAVRGDGTVSMHWDRTTNVVDLEITPIELNGFETPVELTLPAPADLSDGELATATMFWWNPAANEWEGVEGAWVDAPTRTVHAPLRHFSSYTAGAPGKAGWRNQPEGRQVTD